MDSSSQCQDPLQRTYFPRLLCELWLRYHLRISNNQVVSKVGSDPTQHFRTSLSSPDLCYYTINARYSAWFRTLPVAFIHTQTLNMLSLTLERVVSTLIPKWYEKITKPYLGFCLLAFSVLSFVVCLISQTSADGSGLPRRLFPHANTGRCLCQWVHKQESIQSPSLSSTGGRPKLKQLSLRFPCTYPSPRSLPQLAPSV